MRLSPSVVGKTIGTQLRAHQDAVLRERDRECVLPPIGTVHAMACMRLSECDRVMLWAVVLVRPDSAQSIVTGSMDLVGHADFSSDAVYQQAILRTWSAMTKTLSDLLDPSEKMLLSVNSQRAKNIISAQTVACVFRGIHFAELSLHPAATRALDDVITGMLQALKAKREEQRAEYALEMEILANQNLVVATDASVGCGQASASYITSQGRFAGWMLPCSQVSQTPTPLVAELWAIDGALTALARHKGKLELKTDSQKAVQIIQNLRTLGTLPSGARIRRVVYSIALHIEALECESLSICWVRGHAGDPLNEIADDIAVLTRRHSQAGITGSESSARVRAFISDAVESLKLAA